MCDLYVRYVAGLHVCYALVISVSELCVRAREGGGSLRCVTDTQKHFVCHRLDDSKVISTYSTF